MQFLTKKPLFLGVLILLLALCLFACQTRPPTVGVPHIAFFTSAKPYGAEDIYAINADGSGLIRLTQTGSSRYPVWSPNPQWIAFTSSSDWLQLGITRACSRK